MGFSQFLQNIGITVAPAVIVARVSAIAAGLGLWFFTQALLARRQPTTDAAAVISDGIHQLTAPIHRKLLENPRLADALLISSSLVIDLLGLYLLVASVVGVTIQPFLGLLILFALRQVCQAFCPLPPPQGMIWRNPGFPALLVTYGTSFDLFFSGHTAIAVFGAACLATAFGPVGIAVGVLIALFEIGTVLVLRAHYTMDVFAGAVTALYVYHVSWKLAPAVDRWIASAVSGF